MQKLVIATLAAVTAATAMPAAADPPPWAPAYGYRDKEARKEARRDYREQRRYERRAYNRDYRLGYNDRVYRGNDGRYYCRRSDGTTGLIVGGLAGGVLGNVIAPGGSKTLGAIIGGGAGALLGRSVDRGQTVCR